MNVTLPVVQLGGSPPFIYYDSNGPQTAAGLTIPLSPALRKVSIDLQLASGTLSNMTLTGMPAGKYGSGVLYATTGSVPSAIEDVTIGANINNNWLLYSSSFYGEVRVPPAPFKKELFYSNRDINAGRTVYGWINDTTTNPTAIVFTFSGSVQFLAKAWGWT